MDKSEVKKFSLILEGGALFCHKNQSCSKLPEMDKSEVKNIFPSYGGGGGLFYHKNQSCSKLPEMDQSEVKNFSLIGGGGEVFCHKNQSCSKLPEMDKSEVKKFFPHPGGGGGGGRGGGFSATKTKVAQSCLKWINLKPKKFSLILGRAFLPQKPKSLEIAWNG